jgi:hypothetical protein
MSLRLGAYLKYVGATLRCGKDNTLHGTVNSTARSDARRISRNRPSSCAEQQPFVVSFVLLACFSASTLLVTFCRASRCLIKTPPRKYTCTRRMSSFVVRKLLFRIIGDAVGIRCMGRCTCACSPCIESNESVAATEASAQNKRIKRGIQYEWANSP